MKLNRNIGPETKKLNTPEVLCPKRFRSTGLPLYYVGSDSLAVVRVRFCFRAGTVYQERPLQSVLCNAMLTEGTRTKTASEIADALDMAGAYVEPGVDHELSAFAVYTIADKLPVLLQLVQELLTEPAFPVRELSVLLEQKKQEYLINSQKVSVIADRAFRNIIYSGHPYGVVATPQDFDSLSAEQLKSFHSQHYGGAPILITLAGAVDDKLLEAVASGSQEISKYGGAETVPQAASSGTRVVQHIEKKDAVQAAIRIGRPFYNLKHPDFVPMQILCIVLGGYFGSRLMRNLREDNGYTYGVHALCKSHRFGGAVTISTEVGVQYTQPAIKEIYCEIDRLKTDLIPENELNRVRQYVLGSFMRQFDGPFKQVNRLNDIFPYGLDMKKYYAEKISTILKITPQRLRDVACMYLDKAQLTEVVCG